MKNTKAIQLLANLKKIIIGKDEVLEMVVIALLSRGHLLIEDIPGIGKTTLVKALAKSIDLTYKRVQFTSDLTPSDIIGVSIYDKNTSDFFFKKGPIFNQIFLADEVNRASPKTQSSLLQAMAESEISTDENHYILEQPFMVLATQNPLEYQGTFPLPEAQLDRFLMRLSLGYPSKIDEIEILKNHKSIKNSDFIKTVIEREDILQMQEYIDDLNVHGDILEYIVNISNASRLNTNLRLGASPRASIDILRASKSIAFISGRDYVIPDDVKRVVNPVLAHRLILSSEARIEKKSIESIIQSILKNINVPVISDEDI